MIKVHHEWSPHTLVYNVWVYEERPWSGERFIAASDGDMLLFSPAAEGTEPAPTFVWPAEVVQAMALAFHPQQPADAAVLDALKRENTRVDKLIDAVIKTGESL